MRRFVFVIGAVIICGAAVLVGMWSYVGGEGESGLEAWIGENVRAVVQGYLKPELSFDSLDYQAPRGVEILGLQLAAPNQPLLSIERAYLELAEIPRRGKPILVERIEVDKPRIHVVQTADGAFVGWGDFVRGEGQREESVDEGRRLSDVLRLRQVVIRDGGLEYRGPEDEEPLRLPGIDVTLNTPPNEERPGWYRLAGELGLERVFALSLETQLNLDDITFEELDLKLGAALGPDGYEVFPPALQGVVRRHEVEGTLDAQVSGRVRVSDLSTTDLAIEVKLDDAHARMEENQVAIDALHVDARLVDALASGRLTAALLGGEMQVDGRVPLRGHRDGFVDWSVDGVELSKTLVRSAADAPPRYAGRVFASGNVVFDVDAGLESLHGPGQIEIEDGQLVNFPLVSDLAQKVSKFREGKDYRPNDTAEAKFEFQEEGVRIESFRIISSVVAARGSGTISYDGTLDLEVNAGPLEKLQSSLGKVGELFGKLTDKLVTYLVEGPISDPRVRVKPIGGLGGGSG